MKRKASFFILMAGIGLSLFLNSCAPTTAVVARNTIDIASLEEINLERKDYEIIDVITAEATVTFNAKKRRIYGKNNEFILRFKRMKGYNKLEFGMLRFGYLAQDVISSDRVDKGGILRKAKYLTYIPADPEIIARRWATYRLIAEAKALGADALIVPVRSSDISSGGKHISIVKTTVTAKAVRLFNN